jgi:FkbM family methyltransferase
MKKEVLDGLRVQGYAPRTLLDVGAHIGTFTRQFLEVFPDCVPTLIEPNPFCQDELSKLAFEQHAVAASDEPGRAELFLTKEWLQSTGSSLYRENTAFFRDEVVVKQEVDKVRIDDLFKGRRFDFVKIDTQGAELDVLRGGQSVLRHADYILVEVSLVEYNIGGARAEAVFSQLDAMGFHCTEVTEFHRLAGVQNGNLLQIDFLFERRAAALHGWRRNDGADRALIDAPMPTRQVQGAIDTAKLDSLRSLARSLHLEGRAKDALVLLEHLTALNPGDAETLRRLVKVLGAEGRTLDAIEKLVEWKSTTTDMEALLGEIQVQAPAAIQCFNDHLAASEVEKAEKYASALVALIPRNIPLLEAALSCNLALGHKGKAAKYAATLLSLDAAHATARNVLAECSDKTMDEDREIEDRMALALAAKSDIHPLIRLRDVHDVASAILCRPLTSRAVEQIGQLLRAAREIDVGGLAGSEWEGWVKHYRLLLDAVDLAAVHDTTPTPVREPKIELMNSSGVPLNWLELRANAARLGAQAVFFAAADRAYVDLYARWYIKSILKHCDVPCLVILHVIGGTGQLRQVVKSVGIKDKRLIFTGDRFDAEGVTTQCYDSPPKGRIAKPVAHFQSIRFLRLGAFLQKLKLPVFVSDIDLLLQRGVKDLLQRCAGADVVFNENNASKNAGSRLTANLLLVNPTDNAALFLRFLRSYLEQALSRHEVTRWIDQFALMLARHHLFRQENPRIDYFDTNTDINNVMYTSYQEHPFRFLSLYHGFDTSSLEDNPKVLGETPKRASAVRPAKRTVAREPRRSRRAANG